MISNELLARSLKTQLEKPNHLIQNSFELRQRSQCCKQGWELVGATAPRCACSTSGARNAGDGFLQNSLIVLGFSFLLDERRQFSCVINLCFLWCQMLRQKDCWIRCLACYWCRRSCLVRLYMERLAQSRENPALTLHSNLSHSLGAAVSMQVKHQ